MTLGRPRSRGGLGGSPGRRRRGALVALLTLAVVLVTSGPAGAHTRLRSSDPSAGSVVATAPTAVTLRFAEPVAAADGAAHVYDDHYERVDEGQVLAVEGTSDSLRIPLRPGLAKGTYVVVWQASSADTHPVTGSFRFSVGAPTPVQGTPPDDSHNDLAGAVLGPLRWLGYAGMVLSAGLLLMVLWLWPEGLSSPRTRRLLGVGAGLLAVATVGSMVVQGVYASGQPFSALWADPGSLDTHSRTFDTVHSVRAFLLVALVALLVAALTFGPRATGRLLLGLRAAAVAVTIALAVTWPLAGHSAATTHPAVTVALNVVHLLAMVVWLGGLVGLLVGSGEPGQQAALGRALPRFSSVALGCVATLVVTGVLLAWSEVGTLSALTPTAYGRVLLAKVGGVLVLVALGNSARVWVERHGIPPSSRAEVGAPASAVPAAAVGAPGLRVGLAGETLTAAVVLGLTTALVVIIPARSDYVEPWSRVITADGATVSVQLPRPRVGDTVALVTVAAPGGRRVISSVTGSVSRPGVTAAAVRLPVSPDGSGADGATEVGLTFDDVGPWSVRLVLTPTSGSPTTVVFTVPIAADA